MSTSQLRVKVAGKTRDKILEVAMRLFAEKGFSGTTTREIAEKADVNEALIFRYFSTKKDLYGAIIERKIEEEPGVVEFTLESLRETRNDKQIFKSIAIRMFESVEKDSTFIKLLYFSALEGHELSDMFFESYVQHQRMLLSDYIKQRIYEGAFKNLDPLLAARAFIGMVANYIIVEELFGDKRKRELQKDEAIET
ncbi:MAG TPA: helix-turn-helix domain-containing protein, partial [Thermodesulfobacteriota bacterium]